jgi:hypothetical protein
MVKSQYLNLHCEFCMLLIVFSNLPKPSNAKYYIVLLLFVSAAVNAF